MSSSKFVVDTFHSMLMDDDEFQEATMRVALKVAQYYAGPGNKLTEDDMRMAEELCSMVGVS